MADDSGMMASDTEVHVFKQRVGGLVIKIRCGMWVSHLWLILLCLSQVLTELQEDAHLGS